MLRKFFYDLYCRDFQHLLIYYYLSLSVRIKKPPDGGFFMHLIDAGFV